MFPVVQNVYTYTYKLFKDTLKSINEVHIRDTSIFARILTLKSLNTKCYDSTSHILKGKNLLSSFEPLMVINNIILIFL